MFIYDNQGSITVYIGCYEKFNTIISSKSLKICDLILPKEIKDPTLFTIEKNRDRSILLVIGGFINKEPCKEIYIFDIFEKMSKFTPNLILELKVGRVSPLVISYFKEGTLKKKNENYLFFIGGNSPKMFKKKKIMKIQIIGVM